MQRVKDPLWLVIIAIAAHLPGCGESPTVPSDRAASLSIAVAPSHATGPSPQLSLDVSTATAWGTASVAQATPTDDASLTAARENPDPAVRLQALESWAQRPGASLDPMTYAMVDPDASVRIRAQELFEQNLARR